MISPDLIGYGSAPAWPAGRSLTLHDEVARICATIPCCERRINVVGYSYGGAVALALAAANPAMIGSLTLIEPVFFAALRYGGKAAQLQALQEVRERFLATLQSGDRDAAMRDFIDYWSGQGGWERMPERHRAAALALADKIALDWEAAFAFDAGAPALALLASRTLLVRGDESPASMIALVDCLQDAMPGSTHTVIRGANHLLPLTHEAALSAALAAHLHAAFERRLR